MKYTKGTSRQLLSDRVLVREGRGRMPLVMRGAMM